MTDDFSLLTIQVVVQQALIDDCYRLI